MTFGAESKGRLPVGHLAGYLLGVAGLAFSMTLLWLGMRAVMDLGGFCASGGPYAIAVACPDAVTATTPLSIFGGLASIGLMVWGGAVLGGSWVGLVLLAWPALFLSLGWNFLAFGLFPPEGGWVFSWVLCGVLFILMGGIPLVAGVWSVSEEPHGGRSYAAGRVVVRPRPSLSLPQPPAASVASAPVESGPLVDRLERLAALRRSGDLTNEEYESAKAATLAEVGDVT